MAKKHTLYDIAKGATTAADRFLKTVRALKKRGENANRYWGETDYAPLAAELSGIAKPLAQVLQDAEAVDLSVTKAMMRIMELSERSKDTAAVKAGLADVMGFFEAAAAVDENTVKPLLSIRGVGERVFKGNPQERATFSDDVERAIIAARVMAFNAETVVNASTLEVDKIDSFIWANAGGV